MINSCFVLTQPGHTMVAVKLTDVDEDGIVSVQLVGPGLTYLDQLLTEINNPSSKIRVMFGNHTQIQCTHTHTHTHTQMCVHTYHLLLEWERMLNNLRALPMCLKPFVCQYHSFFQRFHT